MHRHNVARAMAADKGVNALLPSLGPTRGRTSTFFFHSTTTISSTFPTYFDAAISYTFLPTYFDTAWKHQHITAQSSWQQS